MSMDISRIEVFTAKPVYQNCNFSEHSVCVQYMNTRLEEIESFKAILNEWKDFFKNRCQINLKEDRTYRDLKTYLKQAPEIKKEDIVNKRINLMMVPIFHQLLVLKLLFNRTILVGANQLLDALYKTSKDVKEYEVSRDLFDMMYKTQKELFDLKREMKSTPAILEKKLLKLLEVVEELKKDLIEEQKIIQTGAATCTSEVRSSFAA